MMNKRIMFAASILILTMLACGLQGSPTASPSAPTVDPAQLNAIIAETVSAVLEQTALAPTSTPLATATPQPEPSATPTFWPQTSTNLQLDGTNFFLDERAGFNISIPPGWLPVRIDQIEYYDAFSLPQAADPKVQTALMNINTLDPNIYRLFIFDLQDGHLEGGFVNNVNFIWLIDNSISLETEDEIKATAEALPSTVPGLVVTSYAISKTINDIPIGMILSETTGQREDGSELKLFQKQIFLNVEEGYLTITFTTEQGIKDATLPFFDSIIESLKIY